MVVLRTTEPYPLATEKPTIKQKIKIEITIKNETAMKKFNDKATRIIMNNGNSMEIKYKSELLEQIRQDFEIMENESSDIDPGFFTEDDVWSLYEFLEDDVWSLYEFLLMRHQDDWYVIDDMKDGDTEDSYYEEEEEYFYEEEHFDNDDNGEGL